jgi:hypothetical protein
MVKLKTDVSNSKRVCPTCLTTWHTNLLICAEACWSRPCHYSLHEAGELDFDTVFFWSKSAAAAGISF